MRKLRIQEISKMKHLLNIFLLLQVIFSSVDSIEESFCAGTGYYNAKGELQRPLSMGWSKLNKEPHSRLWGANHAVSSGSEPDRIIIEMRKVEEPKRGKNSEMNGWLQVKIKTKDSSHKIQVMAVWALTDTRESLGEFISLKSAKCESIPTPSWNDENIIPCAAAPANEPSNPNMFVYVNKGNGPLTGEVNLLWKTSVSYCNFPKKFRFMVAINTKAWGDNPSGPSSLNDASKGPRVYASQWISPKFYGPAAAPLYEKDKLKCSTAISPANRPQWVKSITGGNVINNELTVFLDQDPWFKQRWGSGDSQNLDNFAQRTTCKPKNGKYAFAGRCTNTVGSGYTTVSSAGLHKCPTNNNFEPSDLTVFQGKYSDYLKKREKILRENCECPPIPSADEVRKAAGTGRKRRMVADDDNDVGGDEDDDEEDDDDPLKVLKAGIANARVADKEIDPPVRPYIDNLLSKCNPHGVSNGSFTKDEQGLCANSQPGKMSYGVRQWHAVSILFCVVVLNPVTSYMARFLKGTFSFTGKTPIPIKTWYIVHIAIVLPMICMYTTGMAAIFRQRPVLGYSYSSFAEFHRLCSYFIFVVGFFEIITGIVRPKNLMLRRIIIALHWLGGIIMNYLGLVVCILSYRIPASPTAFVPHVNREKFESIWSHMAPLILVAWGIVDISFQIFITVHVLAFDKKFGIRRSHFPIIIPIMVDKHQVRVHEEFEKEENFQKGAFTMYVILSFLAYLLTVISIYSFNNTFNEQSYGPMFCSHNKYGAFLEPEVKPKSYWYC